MLQPIKHVLHQKKIILASGSPRRRELVENIVRFCWKIICYIYLLLFLKFIIFYHNISTILCYIMSLRLKLTFFTWTGSNSRALPLIFWREPQSKSVQQLLSIRGGDSIAESAGGGDQVESTGVSARCCDRSWYHGDFGRNHVWETNLWGGSIWYAEKVTVINVNTLSIWCYWCNVHQQHCWLWVGVGSLAKFQLRVICQ